MADARTVLAQRGALEALAARDGHRPCRPTSSTLFQDGDLAEAPARGRGRAQRDARRSTAAAATPGPDSDPLTMIGILGEDPEAEPRAAAEAAFAARGPRLDAPRAPPPTRASDPPGRRAWEEGRRRARCSGSRPPAAAAGAGRGDRRPSAPGAAPPPTPDGPTAGAEGGPGLTVPCVRGDLAAASPASTVRAMDAPPPIAGRPARGASHGVAAPPAPPVAAPSAVPRRPSTPASRSRAGRPRTSGRRPATSSSPRRHRSGSRSTSTAVNQKPNATSAA